MNYSPCRAICEICRKEVTTYVKTEFNQWAWILLIAVFYFYGLYYGSFILLVGIPLCRNVIHSCPYCFDSLLIKKFYPYSWIQYGKCVIVVRQFYINVALIVVLAFGFYINITALFNETEKSKVYQDHSHEIDEKVKEYYSGADLTWQDLVNDCGSYVMTENAARGNEIFNRRYFKRIIEWKGYFLNAYVNGRNPLDFNPDHLMNINIRMIPSESIKNPDLFLSLDFKRYQQYGNIIKTLYTGYPIKFKASLEALGNEWRPHHLHLIHIEKTEDFIDHDHKVVLFQGVSFNITGHLKIEKEIEHLQSLIDDKDTNSTISEEKIKISSENKEETKNNTSSSNN